MGLLISLKPLHESKSFAWLWTTGAFVSISAQAVQMAIAWTVYDQTSSSLAVGGIGLAIGIPTLVFGLIGGAVTDIWSPRATGIIGVAGQLGVTLMLFITMNFTFSLPWLYVLIAVQSAFGAITTPTRRPYIRLLLSTSSIPAAMGLYALSMNLGQIVGPVLGSLLLSRGAISAVFVFHAAILLPYLYSMLSLPMIEASSSERLGARAIVNGLRVSWRTKPVRAVLLCDLLATFFALPMALLPALNEKVLGGDATTYGLLLASLSAGGFIATIFSGWLEGVNKPVTVVAVFAVSWCAVVMILGLNEVLIIAVIALALMGVFDVWSIVVQHTVVQRETPQDLLGRVGSVKSIVGMAGPQLGNFRAGVVGSLLGTQGAIVFGAATAAIFIGGLYGLVRRERKN